MQQNTPVCSKSSSLSCKRRTNLIICDRMTCFHKVIQWYLLTLLQQTLNAGDCSAEPGYLGTGHNVPGYTPGTQVDSDGCAIQCGNVQGCAFWTFDLGSSYCWLKTSDTVKGVNTEAINFLWGGPCTSDQKDVLRLAELIIELDC